MFRKATFSVVVLAVITISGMNSVANAGCNSGYGYGYRPAVYSPSFIQHQYYRPVVHQATPVAFAPLAQEQLPAAPAGSTITLPANFLGHAPGSVFLVFRDIKLPVQVNNWSNEGVTITLPPMAIRQDVTVRIDVVLPHGQLGLQQRLIVSPPAQVILHPTAPTSPLPTNAALLSAGLLEPSN